MKKLLCGIFAVMLVFSVFSACAETEAPTTTTTIAQSTTTNQDGTTTAPDNVKAENLEDYIGYWYNEDSLYYYNYYPAYVECEIYISAVIDDGDRYGVSLEVYEGMGKSAKLDYVAIDRNTNKGKFTVDWSGTRVIQFKNNTIEYDYHTLDYKTDKKTMYYDIRIYDGLEFIEKYNETYWYAYDYEKVENSGEVEFNELHIKKATTDGYNYSITFDYSYGEYSGKNVTAQVDYKGANFVTADGKTAKLRFDGWEINDSALALFIDGEWVCTYNGRTLERVTGKEKNRDLSEFVGYWCETDMPISNMWETGMGVPEIWVKSVDGNKVTFGYAITMAIDERDEFTVEINNNIGVFTLGTDTMRRKAVIRFDDDCIHISFCFSDGVVHSSTYAYQKRYSTNYGIWEHPLSEGYNN